MQIVRTMENEGSSSGQVARPVVLEDCMVVSHDVLYFQALLAMTA